MKTNNKCPLIEKFFTGQMSKNEKKEAEKQAKSDPSSKDVAFQKSFLDAAKDEDFNEIFPKLKAAEKNYLKTRSRESSTPFKLIKFLIAAFFLVLFILFVRQLFFSE